VPLLGLMKIVEAILEHDREGFSFRVEFSAANAENSTSGEKSS
jgi:hypothetical protein